MYKAAAIFGLSMGVCALILLACLNWLSMYTRPESQMPADSIEHIASCVATFCVVGFVSGAKWARKSSVNAMEK
jgi:hypothetical protein